MNDNDPTQITKWLADEPQQIQEWIEQHGVKTYGYMLVLPVPGTKSVPKKTVKSRLACAIACSDLARKRKGQISV